MEGARGHVGAVLYAHFCCKPKTALKNKVFFRKVSCGKLTCDKRKLEGPALDGVKRKPL